MSEAGKPNPGAIEAGEGLKNTESRFGDKEKIIEAMLEGDVEVLGNIEEIVADIEPHANEVKIARIEYQNINTVQVVKVRSGENGELMCIFKPQNGESGRVKDQYHIENFYPRECAAYLVSEHFGFDVVPPTVVREIGGQIGALQLFLSHDQYADYAKIFEIVTTDEESDKLTQGADFRAVAVLDWIIANADRNPRNMMFNTVRIGELFAIDHGVIMNGLAFVDHALRGPARSLTWDNQTEKPVRIEIPASLADLLKDGYERREELTRMLVDRVDGPAGVTEAEIDAMWRRVKLMIDMGIFLSPKNFQEVTNKPLSHLESGLPD